MRLPVYISYSSIPMAISGGITSMKVDLMLTGVLIRVSSIDFHFCA